jgi:hypothetical protein
MANKKAEIPSVNQMGGAASPTPTEAVGSDEDRLRQIATAAFLRAASRDFVGGDPVEDWLQAEMEIDASPKAR